MPQAAASPGSLNPDAQRVRLRTRRCPRWRHRLSAWRLPRHPNGSNARTRREARERDRNVGAVPPLLLDARAADLTPRAARLNARPASPAPVVRCTPTHSLVTAPGATGGAGGGAGSSQMMTSWDHNLPPPGCAAGKGRDVSG